MGNRKHIRSNGNHITEIPNHPLFIRVFFKFQVWSRFTLFRFHFSTSISSVTEANNFLLIEGFEVHVMKIEYTTVNLTFASWKQNLPWWIWFSPHNRQIYSGEFDFHLIDVKSAAVDLISASYSRFSLNKCKLNNN